MEHASASTMTHSTWDSPNTVLGFQPLQSCPSPGAPTLRTQRSLLADLLAAANYSNDGLEEGEPEDDAESCVDAVLASSSSMQRPWCSCGVGAGVAVEFHGMDCTARSCSEAAACCDADMSSTAPIAIPQKTYYKCQRQIEERARIQYHRQLYRAQMDAQQQANMQSQQALVAQKN